MERRGFLKGLFGGVAATGLIVAATPREVETFARAMPVGAPVAVDAPPQADGHVGAGEHLYNSRGELVAIVTSLTVSRGFVDVTSIDDSFVSYVHGMPDIQIHATGVGQVSWSDGTLALRGQPRR